MEGGGAQAHDMYITSLPTKVVGHICHSRVSVCDFLPLVANRIKPVLHALLQFSKGGDPQGLLHLAELLLLLTQLLPQELDLVLQLEEGGEGVGRSGGGEEGKGKGGGRKK